MLQIKIYTKGQNQLRVIDLREIEDDLQTLFVRGAASVFEFKAVIEGSMTVEGVLRYHPFLYDRETYPYDINDRRSKFCLEDIFSDNVSFCDHILSVVCPSVHPSVNNSFK